MTTLHRPNRAAGEEAAAAQRGREELDARLQSGMTAGLLVRHQPGNPGMSQLDMLSVPTAWLLPLDYEQRLTVRADAVTVDAGGAGAKSPAGTLNWHCSGSRTRRPAAVFSTVRQAGMSVGAGYRTDSWSADVGTTPLGFLLTNAVGGVEWTPHWSAAQATLGVSRRAGHQTASCRSRGCAIRSRVLRGAPIVQTGPYAGLALYRERYSLAGSVQFDELTGTHVESNQFLGAHAAADWKPVALATASLSAGVTLDYWNFQHNLSNYTFGSGGYYSPQSYLSLAAPVEIDGLRAGWNYRLRVALSYTRCARRTRRRFIPTCALQNAAVHSPLPAGYSAPYFGADRSNSLGIYALAACEREVLRGLVVGGMLELDRTDYYHPTTASLYIRHAFGSAKTRAANPVQPVASV